MSHLIRISDTTYKRLQDYGEFHDTMDTVILRLLDYHDNTSETARQILIELRARRDEIEKLMK